MKFKAIYRKSNYKHTCRYCCRWNHFLQKLIRIKRTHTHTCRCPVKRPTWLKLLKWHRFPFLLQQLTNRYAKKMHRFTSGMNETKKKRKQVKPKNEGVQALIFIDFRAALRAVLKVQSVSVQHTKKHKKKK